MEIYLVGGAVRDKLLRLPIKEKDWVVVGSTVDEMLSLGFRQVGKDFPVFLHPETNEEYALARVEKKIDKGYKGFIFDTSQTVTIEEDLSRRDLTINAIAMQEDGNIIDPYGGSEDIQNKILRHVSHAFIEDPVRILRVARFAARFANLGFVIAEETIQLMRQMVNAGEVDALVPERVWKEWERAFTEERPEKFFEVLGLCGALAVLFPEINLDTEYQNLILYAAQHSTDASCRFAIALYYLNEIDLEVLLKKYRVPIHYADLAKLVNRFYEIYLRSQNFSAEEFLKFLMKTDAFRRKKRFIQLLTCVELIANFHKVKNQNHDLLKRALLAASSIQYEKHITSDVKGKEIAQIIFDLRKKAIQKELNLN